MSDEVVGSVATNSYGVPQFNVTKQTRITYEVYTSQTVLLRTVHEVQALRYAKEVNGEVRTMVYNSLG